MTIKSNSIIKEIDVSEIIAMLNKAYADEWLAYYQYFTEAKVVKGIMKRSVLHELNEHAEDELRHANLLADRILQLGGTPLLTPKEWFSQTNCGYMKPKKFNVKSILKEAIKGEQCAIVTYSKIAQKLKNKDIVTYDMVNKILADEVEHEHDLQSIVEDINDFVSSLKK